mmetsp:Transcript_8723/g.16709  ORF Transcript_8723/g.16709 Transcript_8723/m.16709 type:complete len:148 (-) Transcript_8723:120-563(-)
MKFLENLDDLKVALESAGGKLVCLDFTATWCGPCKRIAPYFEALADSTEGDFYKVDVDDADDIAQALQIKSMPTFVFFLNGEEVGRLNGANPKALQEAVEKFSPVSASAGGGGQEEATFWDVGLLVGLACVVAAGAVAFRSWRRSSQ